MTNGKAGPRHRPPKVFGVTQPRVSNLIHGKIDLFGLDMLVKMATAAGLRVTMRVTKAV
jgi:predicted XRE-type DNA-binding protein